MFAVDYFGEEYFAADYFPPGEISIPAIPQNIGGGAGTDWRKKKKYDEEEWILMVIKSFLEREG